jgi:hypothetical protein
VASRLQFTTRAGCPDTFDQIVYIYKHKRLVGKPEERNHLESHGGDGRILRQILRNLCVRVWSGLIWLRIRSSGRLLGTS